jgi:hypothetical protein
VYITTKYASAQQPGDEKYKLAATKARAYRRGNNPYDEINQGRAVEIPL